MMTRLPLSIHTLYRICLLAVVSLFLACCLNVAASDVAAASTPSDFVVHKYAQATDDQGLPNDSGDMLSSPSALGDAVEGAGFALYEIAISPADLSTFVGTSKVNPASGVPESVTFTRADGTTLTIPVGGVVRSGITDEAGSISWLGVEQGYYVVCETDAAYGVSSSLSSAVALPYIRPDGSQNTQVHVYPKSVKDTSSLLTKKADRAVVGVESNISWTIGHAVGRLKMLDSQNNAVYGRDYFIEDTLDYRLDFVAHSARIKLFESNGNVLAVSMVEGVDYTETFDAHSRTVTWRFVEDIAGVGVQKIADSKAAFVELTFDTAVNEQAYKDASIIENGAHLEFVQASVDPLRMEYSNSSFNETNSVGQVRPVYGFEGIGAAAQSMVDVPSEYARQMRVSLNTSDTAQVAVGGMVLTKYDGREVNKLLGGAIFKVASSYANATEGKFVQQTDADGNRIDIQVTTDSAGQAFVGGLAPGSWYLVETVSPQGYVRLASPLEITVGSSFEQAKVHVSIPNEAMRAGLPGNGLVVTGDTVGLLVLVLCLIASVSALCLYWVRRMRLRVQARSLNNPTDKQ